jgi:hypothetical protein
LYKPLIFSRLTGILYSERKPNSPSMSRKNNTSMPVCTLASASYRVFRVFFGAQSFLYAF